MHSVCDAIRDNIIVVQWCSARDILAAILTKFSLPAHQHFRLALRVMFRKCSVSKAMV